MRVFVAGATGAIGKQLVPRLVAAGHEVHGMTRSASNEAMLEELGAVPVVADALDPHRVAEAVGAAGPDVIVHQLTAIGAVDTRHMERDFALTNRLRTEGTDHLLAAGKAVGVRRFVAQSNAIVYGRTGAAVQTEEGAFDPSPASTMRANQEAIRHLETAVLGAEWTEGIALRYGWFYGPGTHYGEDGSLAGDVRKRRFPVIGSGAGLFSWIHVDDAADATVAAVERGAPGVYNVVDDEPAALRDWLPVYAEAIGAPPPRHVPVWLARLFAGKMASAVNAQSGASNAKAKRELGWEPRWSSWREGFREAPR
jgi:nucleoside-diphosphate-sugar epimerase